MALSIKPADLIKARVIDFLIELFDGVIIGNEVKYGSSRKVVDLLALYNNETYAIEIKSSQDDLRRLPVQLAEYSRIFDHTIVFSTNEHLSRIRSLTKNSVSLYEVDADGGIDGKYLRRKNRTQKGEMLATMNSSFLRKQLRIVKTLNSDDIRRKAMRYNKVLIHALLYDYFKAKLSAPFKLFLEERSGERTEIDDIIILSNRILVD